MAWSHFVQLAWPPDVGCTEIVPTATPSTSTWYGSDELEKGAVVRNVNDPARSPPGTVHVIESPAFEEPVANDPPDAVASFWVLNPERCAASASKVRVALGGTVVGGVVGGTVGGVVAGVVGGTVTGEVAGVVAGVTSGAVVATVPDVGAIVGWVTAGVVLVGVVECVGVVGFETAVTPPSDVAVVGVVSPGAVMVDSTVDPMTVAAMVVVVVVDSEGLPPPSVVDVDPPIVPVPRGATTGELAEAAGSAPANDTPDWFVVRVSIPATRTPATLEVTRRRRRRSGCSGAKTPSYSSWETRIRAMRSRCWVETPVPGRVLIGTDFLYMQRWCAAWAWVPSSPDGRSTVRVAWREAADSKRQLLMCSCRAKDGCTARVHHREHPARWRGRPQPAASHP